MKKKYLSDLKNQIELLDLKKINLFSEVIKNKHKKNKNIFICGNGGSAANADHITNDLMFGFTKKKIGFNFISLCSNTAKITCLANDIGYEKIFSNQLKIQGRKGDLLIVLTGSGNSRNIIQVVNEAKLKKIDTFGLIGFDGGKVKNILDDFVHFKIDDMQISEDLQMIVMNYVMKKIIKDKFKF